MNEDFDDYLSEYEIKLLAKQAKCRHGEYKIFISCQDCGKSWSEKNLHIGLKNEIMEEESRI